MTQLFLQIVYFSVTKEPPNGSALCGYEKFNNNFLSMVGASNKIICNNVSKIELTVSKITHNIGLMSYNY